jgi:tryptophan-rich sensory protein
MRDWKSLAVFLVLAFAAGGIGSLATPDAWYAGLNKPSFNPPGWIFAPVWAALFVLMAIAAWRVYLLAGLAAAVVLWLVQLVFNAIWSPLFFGLHSITLALVDVALLLALVLATTMVFFQRDRAAGLLMLPYVAWVSFATLLTFSIYRLNAA